MQGYDDIYAFLERELRVDCAHFNPDISLRDDLGVEGDDSFELEAAFARHFDVDMSSYRWYFHHGEEGSSLNVGSLFFSPPYKRVGQIAVTPRVLLDSANAGKWVLSYPPHEIPARRYDTMINQVVFGVLILLILGGIFRRLAG